MQDGDQLWHPITWTRWLRWALRWSPRSVEHLKIRNLHQCDEKDSKKKKKKTVTAAAEPDCENEMPWDDSDDETDAEE